MNERFVVEGREITCEMTSDDVPCVDTLDYVRQVELSLSNGYKYRACFAIRQDSSNTLSWNDSQLILVADLSNDVISLAIRTILVANQEEEAFERLPEKSAESNEEFPKQSPTVTPDAIENAVLMSLQRAMHLVWLNLPESERTKRSLFGRITLYAEKVFELNSENAAGPWVRYRNSDDHPT